MVHTWSKVPPWVHKFIFQKDFFVVCLLMPNYTSIVVKELQMKNLLPKCLVSQWVLNLDFPFPLPFLRLRNAKSFNLDVEGSFYQVKGIR